eukprot:jgi/Hompol1/1687/HPOL_001419-RA
MVALFEQRETEENWTKMEDALLRLTAIVRGSAQLPGFATTIKTRMKTAIVNSLCTDRTRLARTAMTLVEELAKNLRERFETLSSTILPSVILLTARANKVFVASASMALKTCIECAGLPTLAPSLAEATKNPSKTMRIAAMESLKLLLDVNSPQRLGNQVEIIETVVRDGVVDSTNEVRDLARSMFDVYRAKFPDRVDRFVERLPDTARKYIRMESSKPIRAIAKAKAVFKHHPGSSNDSVNGLADDSVGSDAASRETFVPSVPVVIPAPSISRLPTSAPAWSSSATGASVGSSSAYLVPRKPLGAPARVLTTAAEQPHLESNRAGQARMTHLSEQLGGAQRIVRQDKPVSAVAPAGAPVAATTAAPVRNKLKPTRVSTMPARPTSMAIDPRPALSTRASFDSAGGNTGNTAAHSRNTSTSRASQPTISIPMSDARSRRGSAMTVSSVSSSSMDGVRSESVASSHSQDQQYGQQQSGHRDAQLDYARLKADMKHSEWLTRYNALQSVANFISYQNEIASDAGYVPADFRSRGLQKPAEIILAGLSDAHYRVVHVALQAAHDLIRLATDIPLSILEHLVPKIMSIHFNSSQKNKHGIGELTQSIIELLRVSYSGDALCEAIAQALHNPEYSMNIRVRTGCLGFLSEGISRPQWEQFLSKPANLKLLISRLAPLATDTDPFINRSLKYIVQLVCDVMGSNFWMAYAGVRGSDKKAMNTLFEVDLETNKSVLALGTKV